MEPEFVKHIVTHCSATKPSQNVTADVIRKWHVEENGWLDIGYHFVILPNGDIEQGRQINVSGAHARGFNRNSIGVCLVGGLDEDGDPSSNYSVDQITSWIYLCKVLEKIFVNARMIGHNELDTNKTCPNFIVSEKWADITSG